MYFEELIKRAYIKADPPNSDEVVLLLAGCRDQIDQNMVVSRADFEAILMGNRAKDPTSEAVLMSIGRSNIGPGDPIWDTMLQRESVVDRFTQLCNAEAERALSELEQHPVSASPSEEPGAGGVEILGALTEEDDPFAETPTSEPAPAPEPFEEQSYFGYPEATGGTGGVDLTKVAPEPEPQSIPVQAEQPFDFTRLLPEGEPEPSGRTGSPEPGVFSPGFGGIVPPPVISSVGMFGIPVGDDGMGAYMDDISKHASYNAEVQPGDLVEDAPAPGSSITTGELEQEPAPFERAVETSETAFESLYESGAEPTLNVQPSGGPASTSEVVPDPELLGVSAFNSETGFFQDSSAADVAAGFEIPDGASEVKSVVPEEQEIEGEGAAVPPEIPAEVEEGASAADISIESAATPQEVPAEAPAPAGDNPVFGFGDELFAGGFGLPGDVTPGPVEQSLGGPAFGLDADSTLPQENPLFSFGPTTIPVEEEEAPAAVRESTVIKPEPIPEADRYDVSGYAPAAQVNNPASIVGVQEKESHMETPDLERLSMLQNGAAGASGATSVPPGALPGQPLPPNTVPEDTTVFGTGDQSVFGTGVTPVEEEPLPVPEEPEPVETPSHADNQLLATVRTAFETFHSLVKQHGLGVILASENLTAPEFCTQLIAEFPFLSQQYNESASTFAQGYDQIACSLVQSLQLEAESAVFTGDLDRAEKCIAPVCKLIYD